MHTSYGIASSGMFDMCRGGSARPPATGAHLTSGATRPFWRHCRHMVIPETLQRRLALFAEGGRFLRNEGELFPNASWVAVLLGQEVIPRAIDPLIAGVPIAEIESKLEMLHRGMNDYADGLPTHEDVLQKYCASNGGSR